MSTKTSHLYLERIGNIVRLTYFGSFDRQTNESDSFSMDIKIQDYEQGIRRLHDHGECLISGKNCELKVKRNSGLELCLSYDGGLVSLSLDNLPEMPLCQPSCQ